MTTFIKAKLKKQSNIDKCRVATNNIIQKITSEQNYDLLRHAKLKNRRLDMKNFELDYDYSNALIELR